MRKLQNIVSNFGNINVRQGNVLVVLFESLRSLRASSSAALYSHASSLAAGLPAFWLGLDAWQGPSMQGPSMQGSSITAGKQKPVGTTERRHEIMPRSILCHRAAA